MLNRLSRALLTAMVLVLAGAALTNAWSKPADLPLNIKETCVPQPTCEVAPTVTLLGIEDAQSQYTSIAPSPQAEQLNQSQVKKESPSREELNAKIEELIEKLSSLLTELRSQSRAETNSFPVGAGTGGTLESLCNEYILNSAELRIINAEWRRFWLREPNVLSQFSVFPTLVPPQMLQTSGSDAEFKSLIVSVKETIGGSIMFGASVNSDAGLIGPVFTIFEAAQSAKAKTMSAEEFKAHQARHFFEIAGQCEQFGDWDMARNCYEEAARVSPTSTFGALASNRVAKLNIASVERVGLSGTEVQEIVPVVMKEVIKKEIIPEARMEPRRLLESWRMLQLGEGFRLAGDLDNAFRCFQDSYAICPASRYGQAAMDRMMEVERARSEQRPHQDRRPRGEEAQEPQQPVIRRPAFSEFELEQRERAHELFVLGENSLREGDLRGAYSLYQETHLAFPDCFYGMRAIQRIQELETKRMQLPEGGK